MEKESSRVATGGQAQSGKNVYKKMDNEVQ